MFGKSSIVRRARCGTTRALVVSFVFVAAALRPSIVRAGDTYKAGIETWHAARIARLKSPDGYLSLAGLFRLSDGLQSFGSDSANALVFPASSPARAGAFVVTDTSVTLQPAADSGMQIAGSAATGPVLLVSDARGNPTVVQMGSLHFYVIDRPGARYIRLKDSRNPAISAFHGFERYPVDARWRIKGKFVPYNPPHTIHVPNELGTEFTSVCRGAVVFTVDGTRCRLEPMEMNNKEMFLVFGDKTSGTETYGGGRFLYAGVPADDGTVILDFNKAYNPPCALTPFATCPLPHAQNRLKVAIRAGEKKAQEQTHSHR